MTVLAHLDPLERALAAHGFPRLSPWWRETLARFYESGRRQLVIRAGRRGGKSSSLCRLAVLEALYGAHRVPPGDVGVVAIVSVRRDEAAERLRTVRAILDVLGVKYRPVDGGLELVEHRVLFRVFTASIAGVSGFTCICAICDEVAKWRDADTGANPATEVLASLRPTMATQPSARIFLSSSPLGRLDAHAAAFDEGETAHQLTAFAPTWQANPSITEQQTRELEPDEDRWRREYAAIPLEGSEFSLLTGSAIDRVTRAEPVEVGPVNGHSYAAAMDPATRANGWTLVIATRRLLERRVRRSVVLAREWRGSKAAPLNSDRVMSEVAAVCAPYGVSYIETDQYHGDSLAAIGKRHGLRVVVQAMTAARKIEIYDDLATRISDGEVELPPLKTLRADMLGIKKRLTANGFTIDLDRTPDGRHCDYAPPVAVLMDRFMKEPVAVDTPSENERWQARVMERLQRDVATARRATDRELRQRFGLPDRGRRRAW